MQHLIQQQRIAQLRDKAFDGWKLTLHAQGCLAAFKASGDSQALHEVEFTLKSLEDHLHALANPTSPSRRVAAR